MMGDWVMDNGIQPETVEDILDWLPIVQGQGWLVDMFSQVRNAHFECPLCALSTEWGENPHGATARVSRAGWDQYNHAVRAVMAAADSPIHPLRPALLADLGVEAPR